MIGNGHIYETASYVDSSIEATAFLMERASPGVEVFHYLHEPTVSTDQLADMIYRFVGKRRPKSRVPLGAAEAIAAVADWAADLAKTGLPITSARIEKFYTDASFSSRKIRAEGFEQRVPIEEALSTTVD